MKKVTLILSLFISSYGFSQTTVNVDPAAAWGGFMNVFDSPADGGGYLWGSGWGVSDLKTVVDAGAGTITLQPNYNTYDAADPYWSDGAGNGNKTMDATTNIQDNALVGTTFTFTGNVVSNTLDAAYTSYAFIRIFDGGYALLEEITAPLTAGSDFSVTYNNTQAGAVNIQYGFTVNGINANPANEAALGSVVVQPAILSIDQVSVNNFSVYPNPSKDSWNITSSSESITNIQVFDILGKQVISTKSNTISTAIDASSLNNGLYIARITTAQGTQTIKLIKN